MGEHPVYIDDSIAKLRTHCVQSVNRFNQMLNALRAVSSGVYVLTAEVDVVGLAPAKTGHGVTLKL